MRLLISKFLINILWRIMPESISIELWKWDGGIGNARIHDVPAPRVKTSWNAVWVMIEAKKP